MDETRRENPNRIYPAEIPFLIFYREKRVKVNNNKV